ncbi:CPBP family intramembrane glutamic endopeptidase [Bacillus seohaeanensis]
MSDIDTQTMISVITLVVLLEVFIVVLFIKYKQGKIDENPFITILQKEWTILFYAFFRWKKKWRYPENVSVFSYYKKSNYFWMFLALMHEQVIEMIVFHIYLKEEDPTFANIMSALHIYSIFYIMGDYNLVRNSPILVKRNNIQMKIGARRELNFHINDIDYIQKASIKYNSSGGIIHEKGVFHATAFPRVLTRVFGMSDELTYEILFKSPVLAKGYFGTKKEITKALLYIDQPDEFVELLQHKINTHQEELPEEEVNKEKIVKKPLINWKLYYVILFINLLGALAMAPYAIARENFHEEMGLSKLAFTGVFTLQTLVETGVLLFLALWMAKKVNLKAPLIESLFHPQTSIHHYKKNIGSSIMYGLLTGCAILLISYFISKPLNIDNSSINEPSWWLGVLGSFGAATTEETIFRLFLVTFFIWLFSKIRKKEVTAFSIWVAITFSALLFGVLHYGIAASTFDMTVGLFASMLLINGIGGIVFGAIFVFVGLEYAMIAHFTADIVIHVIAPLFI